MRSAALLIVLCAVIGCGEVTRTGTSPVHLIVERLEGAQGDDDFGQDLQSDVVTVVNGAEVRVGDRGRVTLSLALKDPGTAAAPNQASPVNAVTLSRYHVGYIRADGRNTPGIDVPYGFDGAVTVTVFDRTSATFALVRAQAKAEAPLAALARSPVVISTIAEVTVYGRDQTGREVSATGWIDVHFANWADPR